jgi:hypothetical protein
MQRIVSAHDLYNFTISNSYTSVICVFGLRIQFFYFWCRSLLLEVGHGAK